MNRRKPTCLLFLLILAFAVATSPLGTIIQREARYILHPIPPPSAVKTDILIGAYYYPWYDTDHHWSQGYSYHPALGEYSSRDSYVADQHIKWAIDHGIDFFAVSWWGFESWEDLSLRIGLLRAKYLGSIRFCIFYETEGLLGGINSAVEVQEALFRHVLTLASVYFHRPEYLRIDGKPVLIFYAAQILRDKLGASFESVFQELRAVIQSEEGLDLYLVGDVMQDPKPTRNDEVFLRAFDAVTAYCPILETRYDKLITKVGEMYEAWRLRGEKFGAAIIPTVFPGFDNTGSNESQKIVVPRSVGGFERFCQIAKRYADPRIKMVMVTTFNEWHEGTVIEPAEEWGTAYLEVIRSVFSTSVSSAKP